MAARRKAVRKTARKASRLDDFSVAVQRCITNFELSTQGDNIEPLRVIDLVQELTSLIVKETGDTARATVHNGIDDLIDGAAQKGLGWLKSKIAGAVAKGTG